MNSRSRHGVAGMRVTRGINNVNCVMRLWCKRIIESEGEVNVGRRQMKRDGLRELEMQYSVKTVTVGIAK